MFLECYKNALTGAVEQNMSMEWAKISQYGTSILDTLFIYLGCRHVSDPVLGHHQVKSMNWGNYTLSYKIIYINVKM